MKPCGVVVFALIAVCVAALWVGCGRPSMDTDPDARPWTAFLDDLLDIDRFARLDTGTTELISSFDRQGGNNDFNYFLRPGAEPGWQVIADLKGPGVVRRFWTTGMKRGHRFRLYFDGEKKPRIDLPVEELFGEKSPFVPPLARYLNFCWFSYVPLTYQKSLRIEIQSPQRQPAGDLQRLYYQLNVERFPPTTKIQTFPARLTDGQTAALARVIETWSRAVVPTPGAEGAIPTAEIPPGTSAIVLEREGEGVLRNLRLLVQPSNPDDLDPVQRQALQQEVLIRIYYDGLAEPSLCLPLGDMFLSAWRSRDVGGLAVGRRGDLSQVHFPVPYQKRIRIEILNQSRWPITAGAAADTGPRHPAHGYLHALWIRSGPQPGAPHPIIDIAGKGKFVGLFLGVTGLRNDWWLLEGDERFIVDGRQPPSWQGTGLEDYFNGGWYYRGGAFAPLNGVLDHAPFRVAQYRFHLVDPLHFESSLFADIERGHGNVSPAWFQSVAWFYLDKPQPVPCETRPEQRVAVDHPHFRALLPLQLDELERLNNFAAARELVLEYLHRFPGQPEEGVLRLRILEYDRLLGKSVSETDYAPFLNGQYGPTAAEQARLLTWFYAASNRALVALNANGPATLYLDGTNVLSGDHPFQLFVKGVELADGPHTLAAEGRVVRQDPWIKFAIRTHTGLAGSGLSTFSSRSKNDGWNLPGGRLENVERLFGNHLPRGTPDAPYIGGIPDAFVLLGSKAYAFRPTDWGYAYRGPIYVRLDFTAPIQGLPEWSRDVTGLPE